MKIHANMEYKKGKESFIFTLDDITEATNYEYIEEEWNELSTIRKSELIRKTVDYNMHSPDLIIGWCEE